MVGFGFDFRLDFRVDFRLGPDFSTGFGTDFCPGFGGVSVRAGTFAACILAHASVHKGRRQRLRWAATLATVQSAA
jgi:hypothetical protein